MGLPWILAAMLDSALSCTRSFSRRPGVSITLSVTSRPCPDPCAGSSTFRDSMTTRSCELRPYGFTRSFRSPSIWFTSVLLPTPPLPRSRTLISRFPPAWSRCRCSFSTFCVATGICLSPFHSSVAASSPSGSFCAAFCCSCGAATGRGSGEGGGERTGGSQSGSPCAPGGAGSPLSSRAGRPASGRALVGGGVARKAWRGVRPAAGAGGAGGRAPAWPAAPAGGRGSAGAAAG